jgi:serine/threonine-protein kinase
VASEDEQTQRALERVGTVISGKWTIVRLLGVGGMGVVYAATHRNKKRAALKMLHRELCLDTAVRERFLREGYVANSIDHPGSVKVDDDDVAEDGSVFLVMELLEGETIQARWERKGNRLGVEEVLSIADRILDVLVVAHAAGVVHRDLKPENLFLNHDGQLKVLDFGIARLREQGESLTATRTGVVMGTPAFMAPEQARGRWESVDHRTDLWAVGATMFTLLTGRYVHGGGTVNEMLASAITRPAQPIHEIDSSVPHRVAKLIDRALAYDMDARFSSARSMQEAVRRAYHGVASGDTVRPPELSSPDFDELARPSEVTPEEQPAPPTGPHPGEVQAGTNPFATGVSVTRTSPDSIPMRKAPIGALLGVMGFLALLVVGVVAVLVSRTKGDPIAPLPPGASAGLTQPTSQVVSATAAPAKAEPAVQREAVSFGDLPVLEAKRQEASAALRAAASASSAAGTVRPVPPAVAAPTVKPTAAVAATATPKPAPTAARPKPASDPFSVRR